MNVSCRLEKCCSKGPCGRGEEGLGRILLTLAHESNSGIFEVKKFVLSSLSP
jgi:hypothetical protein